MQKWRRRPTINLRHSVQTFKRSVVCFLIHVRQKKEEINEDKMRQKVDMFLLTAQLYPYEVPDAQIFEENPGRERCFE